MLLPLRRWGLHCVLEIAEPQCELLEHHKLDDVDATTSRISLSSGLDLRPAQCVLSSMTMMDSPRLHSLRYWLHELLVELLCLTLNPFRHGHGESPGLPSLKLEPLARLVDIALVRLHPCALHDARSRPLQRRMGHVLRVQGEPVGDRLEEVGGMIPVLGVDEGGFDSGKETNVSSKEGGLETISLDVVSPAMGEFCRVGGSRIRQSTLTSGAAHVSIDIS